MTVDGSDRVIARPGALQSVIDEHADAGDFGRTPQTTVSLVTNEVYQPTRTIELRRGIVLACNGAKIRPAHGGDVIHQYPETSLLDPFIDVRGEETFSSTLLRWDTAFDGPYGDANWTVVRGARLFADPGRGQLIEVVDSAGRGINAAPISGFLSGGRVGVTVDGGPRGWANGLRWSLTLTNFRTGMRLRNRANGHLVFLQAQPLPGTAERLWHAAGGPMERATSYNTVFARAWDRQSYAGPVVELDRQVGGGNTFVDLLSVLDERDLRDRSRPRSNQFGSFLLG